MESIEDQLISAQNAKKSISTLSDKDKQSIITRIAQIISERKEDIIAENLKDLEKMSDTDPKKDRLLLNAERIIELSKSLVDVSNLEDPTNKILSEKTIDNGLFIQKRTVPLGVVGVIYESRPNVTLDVAALCIRSGNVCLLRGGRMLIILICL
ncbi:hypothetical protein [Pedobacter panaciterrae]